MFEEFCNSHVRLRNVTNSSITVEETRCTYTYRPSFLGLSIEVVW